MPLSLSVGQAKPLWKRVLPWLGLATVPLGLFVLFLIFLGINQIGNDITATPPARPVMIESVFIENPELYFLVWPSDTRESRERLLGFWKQELARYAPDSKDSAGRLPADPERMRDLQEAIYRMEIDLKAHPAN